MTDARIGTAILEIHGDFSTINKQAAAFFGKFGKTAKMAGGVAAVGAAAVTAGKALYDIGAEFDEAYDKIRVGTGKTGKQLGRLEKDFKNVVSSVPADFGDAADAIAGINSRLGLTGKPLRKLSKQMLELSRITETDLGGNIKNVSRAFGDWAVPVKKQTAALDLFFRASQQSGASVADITDLIVKFGSPLRQLGFNLGEATAMFASFEKSGVNIQTMVPGLKLALGNFLEQGKDPGAALKKAFKGIETGALSSTEILKIFGKRAGADMVEAVEQGRFHLAKFQQQIVTSDDTVMKAGRSTMDASEKFKLLGNKLKVLVEPAATAVFNAVGNLAGALAKVNFQKAFKDAGPTLREIADIAKRVWSVIGPSVREALKQAGQFFKNFARTIKGIIQLIDGILTGDFGKIWEGVKNIFGGGIKAALALMKGMTIPVRNLAGKVGDAMSSAFSGAWRDIKDLFRDGVNTVIGWLNTLADVLEKIPGVPDINIGTVGGGGHEASTGKPGGRNGGGNLGKGKSGASYGRARGGPIFGGDPVGDTVPAMLERGEYVLNRKAVAAIGQSHLDAINFKAAPRFSIGGAIGDLAGKAAGAVSGVLNKGASYFIGKLPVPHIPEPFSGVGSYVIDQVTDYIKSGFQSKKLGKFTGMSGLKGSGRRLMEEISRRRRWNFADWWALDAAETSHGANLANPTSSARLRGQFLDMNWGKYGPGSDPAQNPSMREQIISMARYIAERYGNPSAAWAFHQGHNYYAKGGPIGRVRQYASGLGGGLHSGIKNVASYVMEKFPGLSVTSTTGGTHAANSLHYSGQAVDLAGSNMDGAAGWIRSSGLYKALAEGIHNPNLSIADGKGVPSSYWGSTTWADHIDHIHLAVTKAWNAAQMATGATGGKGKAQAKTGLAGGYPVNLNFGPLPDTVQACTAELHERRTQLRQMEAAKKGSGDDKALDKAIKRLGTRIKALVRRRAQLIAKHHRVVGRNLAARGMFPGLTKMLQGQETDFNSASEMAERLVALEPENLTDSYVGQERGAWGGVLDRLASWRDKVVYSRNTADTMRKVFEGQIRNIQALKGTPAYKKQKWRIPALREAVSNAAAFVGERSEDLEGFQGIGGPQTMLGSLGEGTPWWLTLGGPGRTIFDTQDTIRQLGLKVGSGGSGSDDSERASLLETLFRNEQQRRFASDAQRVVLEGWDALRQGIMGGLPKYHTGGIIHGAPGSEQPVMAQPGEGIFTPEQMAALGGNGSVVIEQLIIHPDGSATAHGAHGFDAEVRRVLRQSPGKGRRHPSSSAFSVSR